MATFDMQKVDQQRQKLKQTANKQWFYLEAYSVFMFLYNFEVLY